MNNAISVQKTSLGGRNLIGRGTKDGREIGCTIGIAVGREEGMDVGQEVGTLIARK